MHFWVLFSNSRAKMNTFVCNLFTYKLSITKYSKTETAGWQNMWNSRKNAIQVVKICNSLFSHGFLGFSGYYTTSHHRRIVKCMYCMLYDVFCRSMSRRCLSHVLCTIRGVPSMFPWIFSRSLLPIWVFQPPSKWYFRECLYDWPHFKFIRSSAAKDDVHSFEQTAILYRKTTRDVQMYLQLIKLSNQLYCVKSEYSIVQVTCGL